MTTRAEDLQDLFDKRSLTKLLLNLLSYDGDCNAPPHRLGDFEYRELHHFHCICTGSPHPVHARPDTDSAICSVVPVRVFYIDALLRPDSFSRL